MVGPQTGSQGVQKRIGWQNRIATEIEDYVNSLYEEAAAALGTMIVNGSESGRFFAFNPLSWPRTDVAELPYNGSASVHVVDLTTGEETPSQIVTVNGERRLQILAKNLPPVGYKVYAIRSGVGTVFDNAAVVNGNVIEDDRYRITVSARGAITSLIDKLRNNRELVRAINGRAVNDLGAGTGSLRVENEGPVSVTLVAESNSPLVHTSRITLKRELDRIEIMNEIKQNFNSTYTWGFGFNIDSPDVWHEEVGAVIRARLLAEGGHYSPRNARYDWLTLNHFADISGTGSPAGVTLSNADCYFMKLGNSTTGFLDTDTPLISVLAGGRVVNGGNGLPDQGGDAYFLQRFAIQARDAYDPANAMRFALAHQNPIVTGLVTGGADAFPGNTLTAVSISEPSVLLWSLKPADDGIEKGIVVRLWNLQDSPQRTSFKIPVDVMRSAQRITHIETPIGSIPVNNGELSLDIEAHQIKSFLIQTDSTGIGGGRKSTLAPLLILLQ